MIIANVRLIWESVIYLLTNDFKNGAISDLFVLGVELYDKLVGVIIPNHISLIIFACHVFDICDLFPNIQIF